MQSSSISPQQQQQQSSTFLHSNSTVTSCSGVSNDTIATTPTLHNNNEGVEISISNLHLQPPHELCLDDLIKDDSYEKLIKGNNNINSGNVIENQHQFIPILNSLENSNYNHINSGMLEFHNNNLTTITSDYLLSSSDENTFNTNYHSALETINEDSIKELLGALR